MRTEKQNEIYDQICEFVGIKNGCLDGTSVYFSVKEMHAKVGGSVWRTAPMGRYQINVPAPVGGRDKIFRTKKADNSFNMLDVADAIKAYAAYRKRQDAMAAARESNREVAEKIILEAKDRGMKKYISSYASTLSSYCVPASEEGLVNVQINFGAVTPEVARKIMSMAQSLEA